jgi:2-aminoethylphosphonate-pyruvate transaminase
MLADWGSRDEEFLQMVANIRKSLLRLAGCGPDYDCVLMQGSGTFAIEAALGSFCPAMETKTLVIANGIYGDRAAQILKHIHRRHLKIDIDEGVAATANDVAAQLDNDSAISHVWVVHCETTTGIVNPVHEIATAVKQRDRMLMVDAMASFGAIPLDMQTFGIDVMASSSNNCLEGVPGFSFVLTRRHMLADAQGKCHSMALDLHDQWKGLEANGQFRFTPPTHALAAFQQALREHERQGGVAARGARYARSAQMLVKGMREMGFATLLDDHNAGPIVHTFLAPRDPNFDFDFFCESLRARGFAIYPGKLIKRPSFRIGTIGQIDEDVMHNALQAIRDVLRDMNVTDLAPPET